MRLLPILPLLLLWPWPLLGLVFAAVPVASEEQSHGWHVHRRADDGPPPGIAARSRDSTSVSGARVATATPRRAKDDTEGVVLLLLILLIVVGTGNDNDAI